MPTPGGYSLTSTWFGRPCGLAANIPLLLLSSSPPSSSSETRSESSRPTIGSSSHGGSGASSSASPPTSSAGQACNRRWASCFQRGRGAEATCTHRQPCVCVCRVCVVAIWVLPSYPVENEGLFGWRDKVGDVVGGLGQGVDAGVFEDTGEDGCCSVHGDRRRRRARRGKDCVV